MDYPKKSIQITLLTSWVLQTNFETSTSSCLSNLHRTSSTTTSPCKRSPGISILKERCTCKIDGAQHLTFEELQTVLCQIEGCLNSRPLLPISSHADDGIGVLTPGHFLVGRPLHALPQHDLTDVILKHWSMCQAPLQHFWRRWLSEYLQQLQRVSKWKQPERNIQPDDIVLIKEDALFNTQWPLGRVITLANGCNPTTSSAQAFQHASSNDIHSPDE